MDFKEMCMNFKEHYFVEMPWIANLGIDFKMEKSDWPDRFVEIVLEYKHQLNKILDPFYNIFYKKFFAKQFSKLSDENKQKIIKVLPNKFVKDMGLE